MNITQAYIFISREKKDNGHDLIIVWERADIDDMMDTPNYVLVGTCQYDTEKKEVISYDR